MSVCWRKGLRACICDNFFLSIVIPLNALDGLDVPIEASDLNRRGDTHINVFNYGVLLTDARRRVLIKLRIGMFGLVSGLDANYTYVAFLP